jgi:para-aminobenzoate synthetase/4-amino-4-deoxychorismate lyase
VLLETAKENATNDKSLLFLEPIEELVAWTREELDGLLSRVDRLTGEGQFVAGFFTYECGEHFVGLPKNEVEKKEPHEPLAWLCAFSEAIEFDHLTGVVEGFVPEIRPEHRDWNTNWTISTAGLEIPRAAYAKKLAQIHEYLSAGDTYQVNFTDRICARTDADLLTVYENLLREQPVPFAAYLNSPYGQILSFSPELFYRVQDGEITVRPMKGTWPRGVNTAGDRKAARLLQNDDKNRSEHVMIVDLLRNDLGRLCEYGSVQVNELFQVERYSTLFQMTSSVSGRLRPAFAPSEVFRTLFPSGSITGAPKRRTMEIIRELEHCPRGVYTGAIGYFAPGGGATFNVAIRTLSTENGLLTLGVGGGITADSVAEREYEECRLKGAFLTRRRSRFSLIETMRCESGIELLPLHMERLADSANYFGISYNSQALVDEITEVVRSCGDRITRVRLEVGEDGNWSISAKPLTENAWNGRVVIACERINSSVVFLHHKTTNRQFYDLRLQAAVTEGFDEILFINESAHITEGAVSNFFFAIDGKWLTPKLSCGLLPGVQRASILQGRDDAYESEIGLADLRRADSVFCCNALRGVREVRSLTSADGSCIWPSRVDD